jgi:hypothetical protein
MHSLAGSPILRLPESLTIMAAAEDPAKAELHNQMERLCDPTHSRTLPAGEFEGMFAEDGFRTALKIERDARLTLDDKIGYGSQARRLKMR